MKISTTSKKLSDSLQYVGAAVKSSTTLPILQSVLIEVINGIMKITADNQEARASTTLNVDSSVDLSVCIQYELFLRILKSLPSAPIDLIFSDKSLNINYSSGEYNIPIVPSKEFPTQDMKEILGSTLVNSAELSEAIGRSIEFVDSTRPDVAANLLIKIGKEKSFVFSMCSHAGVESEIRCKGDETELLLSKSAATHIKNLLLSDEEVKMTWSDNIVMFEGEDSTVSCVLSAGKYPPYEKMFQKESENVYNVSQSDILPPLKRMSNILYKGSATIKMSFSGDKLQMTHNNDFLNQSAKESLGVDYSGEPFGISFNAFYIKSIISVFPDTFKMYLSSPKSGCLIKADGIRGIIAPVLTDN